MKKHFNTFLCGVLLSTFAAGPGSLPASAQASLRGRVATVSYPVKVNRAGQQFYYLAPGVVVYLPGAGVAGSVVQVYSGPLGNQWYVDRTGQRVNIPPATQESAAVAAPAPIAPVASTFAPVIAPVIGAPAYPAPYPYSPVPPVNATGTVNVYPTYPSTAAYPAVPATAAPATTTYPTNTTYPAASYPQSGTVNTAGSGSVNTPQGTYSYDHSGSTSYSQGTGATSSGSTQVTTPTGQSYDAGHSSSVSTQPSTAPSPTTSAAPTSSAPTPATNQQSAARHQGGGQYPAHSYDRADTTNGLQQHGFSPNAERGGYGRRAGGRGQGGGLDGANGRIAGAHPFSPASSGFSHSGFDGRGGQGFGGSRSGLSHGGASRAGMNSFSNARGSGGRSGHASRAGGGRHR